MRDRERGCENVTKRRLDCFTAGTTRRTRIGWPAAFDHPSPAAYIPLGISHDIRRRQTVRTGVTGEPNSPLVPTLRTADTAAEPRMDEHTPQTPNSEPFATRSATALRDLEQRAQAALDAQRGQLSRLETEIARQLEAVTAAVAEQFAARTKNAAESEQAHAEIERLRAIMDDVQELSQRERTAHEAELAELRKELQEQAKTLASAQAQRDADRHDFAARETAWNTERAALEAARAEQLEMIATREAQQRASQDEWRRQLDDLEQKRRDQHATWNGQRSEWNEVRAGLERERDELRQKSDLALEDVQRLRSRTAELELELARRPETSQAELAALRAERDALADRVEQLQRQPAAQIDPNTQQELADLQRRCELTVDDLRELKTKNTQLEAKVAAAAKRATGSADSGGMDWESQKRRVLASLEGDRDDDPISPQQRATIESTIEMTDAVVVEKNREIAELKAQLAASGEPHPVVPGERPSQQINELLDADEVIAEHRQRIAQLEREIEDKLRAAELELSIERARLAREKASLEELGADLESRRQSHDASGAAAGAPRRRWLSKLGLGGDDEA